MGFRIERPATAFSLDTSSKDGGGRVRDEKHLKFIRRLPCLVCGARNVEAAHVRFGSPVHKKPGTGIGTKPSDCWVTPMCRDHHREQHAMNEKAFWDDQQIDPVATAVRLFECSGDIEAGEKIVASLKRRK